MKHFWGIILRWKFWAVLVLFFSWGSIKDFFSRRSQNSSTPEEKHQAPKDEGLESRWQPYETEPDPGKSRRALEIELSILKEKWAENQKAFNEAIEEQGRTGATGLEEYWQKKNEEFFGVHHDLQAKIIQIEEKLSALE